MEDAKTIRTLKILNITTILFILYNTLLPFKPYSSFQEIIRHLDKVEFIPLIVQGRMNPLTDLVGNVLLFIPFGFFLVLYFLHQKGKAQALLVVVLGMLFSLSIEVLQIGFRYRTPSTTDIVMNTIGTAFGAIAAKIYFRHLALRVQRFLEFTFENEPVTLILVVIILVQLFGSLLPFNVTITVSDLKKALAYANIQPFGVKPLGLVLGATVKHADRLSFSWAKFFGNMLFYTIYGYLVMYAYFQYWRGRKEGKWFVVALLILYFPLLEITQFFIKSRTSDINDVISGYLGALTGVLILLAVKKKTWFTGDRTIQMHHLIIPFALYLFYIFYTGFIPFNFTLSSQVVQLDLKIRNLVPFYAYYKVTSLWNIYDLLESFFMLMPLGFVWALLKNRHQSFKQAEMEALTLGLVVALVIEVGQVFLPTRVGEITDVIVMTAGCYVGARLYRYYYLNFLQKNDFIRSLTEQNN
jgi:glycopeptide antibiotics resistance protein